MSVAHGSLSPIDTSLPAGITVIDNHNGNGNNNINGNSNSGSGEVQGSTAAINALLSYGIDYMSNPGYTGADTLTLTVQDAAGASDSKKVAISVLPSSIVVSPAEPTSGTHYYGPFVNANSTFGVVAVSSRDTGLNYNSNGGDSITENVATFDPFLLPFNGSSFTIDTSFFSGTQFPKSQVELPNLTATSFEGIEFYETPDANGGLDLNRVILAEGASPSSPLSPGGSIPVATGVTGNSFFSNFANNSSGIMTSYGIAWDLYNSGAFSIDFQIFNLSNNATAPVSVPISNPSNSDGFPAYLSAPAWFFRSAGSGSAYGLAYAELISGLDNIHFQGYATNGNPTSLVFNIAPDLSPGATNQITQEAPPPNHTGSSLGLEFAPIPGSTEYAFAWNETVTNGAAPDQVEFAIYNATTHNVVSQSTFQMADAQNIRIQAFSLNGASYEVLAYGDSTATHIVEFDSNGNQVGLPITDPTSQQFDQLISFGDGRVGITYDDVLADGVTSQQVTKVFDLRTTGLPPTVFTDGHDKYFAGTQFNDTVIGENNVNNTYYYVGQDAPIGSGPTDSFTGGNGTSWNVAILPDARSNYLITFSSFTALGSPYANTQPQGINDLGQIIGQFTYSGGYFQGFLDTVGTFTGLYDPIANSSIFPNGINSMGQIVGYYTDSNGISHGFLYSGGNNGTYTTIDDQSGVSNIASGINDAGQIVGAYKDSNGVFHGFLYSGGSNGTFSTLNDPLATNGTAALGINSAGQIVGAYKDSNGVSHAFLYSGGVNGTYTTIDDQSGVSSIANGINDVGQIVGYYTDSNGVSHGFLYSGGTNGTFSTLNDPLATNGTAALGINDADQIVGAYTDSAGTHGFVVSASGATILTNAADPAHTGTLNLINVQALAFAPTSDPSGNSGTLEATGDTLLVLGPIPNGGEPITIANGSTLELPTSDTGTITFMGPTGKLILDNPALLTGQIASLGVGEPIDLVGTQVQSAVINGSTVTITETNNQTLSYTLAGALVGYDFTVGGDAYGGTDLVLEPIPYLWSTSVSPAQPTSGAHLYGAFVTTPNGSSNGDLVAAMYGDTSSGYTDTGPDAITTNLLTLDPFLLPYQSVSSQIDTTTLLPYPHVSPQINTTTIPDGDFPHNRDS